MDFKEKSIDNVETGMEIKKPMRWRDLVAFWILGLCNNYGYVVMLSGAHDILITNSDEPHASSSDVKISQDGRRECNAMSTGAILLADILPSLIIKVLSPFLPQHSSVRMVIAIILSSMGYLLVAFANTEVVAISGVVCTSLSSGLGESTLLAYSSHYNPNVISTWSSGTGGAGIFGAASYAILRQIGLSASDTLLLMLTIPFLMCIAFWIVLTKPTIRDFDKDEVRSDSQEEMIDSGKNKGKCKPLFLSIRDNAMRMPPLFKYMGPLLLVYLFEYFINQGLYELIDFKGIWLDHNQQYRWLNVTYQIGVFISRSSVNIFPISKIWVLALLQGINVVLFLSESLYYFVPSIWIILAFTIWEGLLGGGAYVNTYYKISRELPEEEREFALGTVSMSDAIGITVAGFLSMPVHNTICALPLPERALSF